MAMRDAERSAFACGAEVDGGRKSDVSVYDRIVVLSKELLAGMSIGNVVGDIVTRNLIHMAAHSADFLIVVAISRIVDKEVKLDTIPVNISV